MPQIYNVNCADFSEGLTKPMCGTHNLPVESQRAQWNQKAEIYFLILLLLPAISWQHKPNLA